MVTRLYLRTLWSLLRLATLAAATDSQCQKVMQSSTWITMQNLRFRVSWAGGGGGVEAGERTRSPERGGR